LNQTLDYYLAEADGTMRNTPGATGAPGGRTLLIPGVNAANVTSATYYAGYITFEPAPTQVNNSLLFNGTALGGTNANNVAQGSLTTFGPSLFSADLLSAGVTLASTNTVQYSVAMSGGQKLLQANIGLLAVTHPLAASPVWNGAGAASDAGNNWTTSANWGGTAPAAGQSLVFGALAPSGYTTCNNDCAAGTQFAGVNFNSAAAAYTLLGNAIALAGPITNQSGNDQAINLGLQLTTGGGTINTGPESICLAGGISGSGAELTELGGGTLTLAGSNSYKGGTLVADGVLLAENASAIPSGSLLSIGASGSVILGAAGAAELALDCGGGAAAPPALTAPGGGADAAPEPSALTLFGVGTFAFLAWRRAWMGRTSRRIPASATQRGMT